MPRQHESDGWFLKYPADVVRDGGFDATRYPYPYVCVQASDGTQEEVLQVQDVLIAAIELRPFGWRLTNVVIADGIALAVLARI